MFGKNSKFAVVETCPCWVFGLFELTDIGLGECRGDTGPPGASDEPKDFFVGERGDVWLLCMGPVPIGPCGTWD